MGRPASGPAVRFINERAGILFPEPLRHGSAYLRSCECVALSILRVIVFGTVTALGTLSVVLVSADRLTHPAVAAVPAPALVRAAPQRPDPVTTGTVTQGPDAGDTAKSRMLTGFDTERLNALMRGETLPAPARKR